MTGTVINLHHHGATVRLADGSLATVQAPELASRRPTYVASYEKREALEFFVERHGRHAVAVARGASQPPAAAAPVLVDAAFERRLGEYLKSTEEWAPPDRPHPAERHFIRKKRRAAMFEARHKPA